MRILTLILGLCAALSLPSESSAGERERRSLDGWLAIMPSLFCLEEITPDRLLLVDQQSKLHLLEREDGESAGWTHRILADGNTGGRFLPGELDARFMLQAHLADPGRNRLLQLNSHFAAEGFLNLPSRDEAFSGIQQATLLAAAEGRQLLAVDGHKAELALFHRTSGWTHLLGFEQIGDTRARALEAVGERVFLLLEDQRLILTGAEGGWHEEASYPDLLGLHRRNKRDLLLLLRDPVEQHLRLELLADAAWLQDLEQLNTSLLQSWPWPESLGHPDSLEDAGNVRDFLLLPEGLLLAPLGQKALLLNSREAEN